MARIAEKTTVGVVPASGEKGVIDGFCQTVAGVVSHLGFKTLVAQHADAAGLAEALALMGARVCVYDIDRRIAP